MMQFISSKHKSLRSVLLDLNHPSANFVAMVAGDGYSWCRLWDKALDHGSHGTEQLQRIIRHLIQPVHDNFRCHLCDQIVSTSWLLHICSSHTASLHSNNLCEQDILDLLIKEHDYIFSIIFLNSVLTSMLCPLGLALLNFNLPGSLIATRYHAAHAESLGTRLALSPLRSRLDKPLWYY